MVHILTAAKSAIQIYAAAIALGANSSISTSETAAAVAELYLPKFTRFAFGTVAVLPNTTAARALIENTIIQYNQIGLGADIRLDHSRVEVVSMGARAAVVLGRTATVPKANLVNLGR